MLFLPQRREHPTFRQRNWHARIILICSLHQYYDYRRLLLSLIDNSEINAFRAGHHDTVLVLLGILQRRLQSFLDRMRGNMSLEFVLRKFSGGTTVRTRLLRSSRLPPPRYRSLGPCKDFLMAPAMYMAFIGVCVKNKAATALGNIMAQVARPWWLSAPAGRERIVTPSSNHRGCRSRVHIPRSSLVGEKDNGQG